AGRAPEHVLRRVAAPRRAVDVDRVELGEERPDERSLGPDLRTEARLVGLDVRIGTHLLKRRLPQRLTDVAGQVNEVVHGGTRERDALSLHRLLDAIDGRRVGALVHHELGDEARPVLTSFPDASWSRAADVVLFAGAAGGLDDVQALLEEARDPLVFDGDLA